MSGTLAPNIPSPAADLHGYLSAIARFPMLSAEKEQELAVRLRRDDDLDAAWQLVTSHLRFVAKIARGYRGYGLAEEDLIQEGNVGLMKAVKRFDPSVGVRLVSFAVHWIKAEIHEFVLRNWRIVKIATTKAQRKLFFNLRSAKKQLGRLSPQEAREIAEDLGVRPDEVLDMEGRLAACDPDFDGFTSEREHSAPAAVLEDVRYNPAEEAEEDEWTELANARLAEGLDALDPRSRDIVTRRWLSEPKAKLRELAEAYDISAERVRQIEKEAFASLRGAIDL